MGRNGKAIKREAMSVFRRTQRYTELLRNFDIAVEKIWPEVYKGEQCVGISHEPDDLERLCVASYSLMKHIRLWLKKKKHDYNEQVRFPNLYTALDQAVEVTREGKCVLALEAERLEQVSRAAYHWMKTYKMLGHVPSLVELEHKTQHICHECRVMPAEDDSGLLCGACSGGGKKKHNCYVCKSEPATDDGLCAECAGYSEPPREVCSSCKTPTADPGTLFCDACGAENPSRNRGVSRIHGSTGPFDDDGYPIDMPVSPGSWRNDAPDMGDMMLIGRFGKVR